MDAVWSVCDNTTHWDIPFNKGTPLMDDFSVPPKIGNKNWSVMGVEGGGGLECNVIICWGSQAKPVCPGGACKQDCLS